MYKHILQADDTEFVNVLLGWSMKCWSYNYNSNCMISTCKSAGVPKAIINWNPLQIT